jgi:hypothetical protein
MSAPTTSRPSFPKLLGTLALVALVIRGSAAWSARGRWGEDRDLYLAIARQILAGEGFSRPLVWVRSPEGQGGGLPHHAEWWLVPEPGAVPVCRVQARAEDWSPNAGQTAYPTAYRPPLYPCVVAIVMWLTGDVCGVIFYQVVCGALTVVLVSLAAKRSGLGNFGLVAGLIVAVDPLLVGYTSQVMTETTAAGLVGFLLWSTSLSRGPWQPLAGGVSLGLCALCRPTFLAVGVVWGLLWCLSNPKGDRRSGVRAFLIVSCSMALMVAPWAIRNRRMLGDWIPSTTHGGYTLRLAHNPMYDAWLAGDRRDSYDGEQFARSVAPLVETSALEHLEREVDRAHSVAAWTHISEHPAEACYSAFSLWKRLWGPIPESQKNAPLWIRWGLAIHWLVVGMAAMIGLWRISGGGRSSLFLLSLALLASFTAVHALYWADSRMRAPLIPLLALLAAGGVRWIWRWRLGSEPAEAHPSSGAQSKE